MRNHEGGATNGGLKDVSEKPKNSTNILPSQQINSAIHLSTQILRNQF